MLKLQDITKDYVSGELTVHALKGVSMEFRQSEFVAILGQSGCGKTTLLNIMGGLDKYTTGDLIINGVSTKNYLSRDWDNYRNNSIGFIFQSYNLIMHQSVLENVELALTLSGVSKKERKERAKNALIQVGLEKEINKKPNQLSGGQMQRVAIARAIVNNPDIILADEPTGALDTETSISVMDILKDIAKDKLVIMVTHNPELAEKYATRIIKMADGNVVGDSKPLSEDEKAELVKKDELKEKADVKTKKKKKKASMSPLTAFMLSLKNLFTKKARTALVSIAGSIGIIGIALVMSVSAGFQGYIDDIQRDTLSSSPVTISQQSLDLMGTVTTLMGGAEREEKKYPTSDSFTSNNQMQDLFADFIGNIKTSDLVHFKSYMEDNIDNDRIHGVRYTYASSLQLYGQGATIYDRIYKNEQNKDAKPEDYYSLFPYDSNRLGVNDIAGETVTGYIMSMYNNMNPFSKTLVKYDKESNSLKDNWELIKNQYDLIEGEWAAVGDKTQMMLIVDEYNQIADNDLFALGLRSEGHMISGVLKNVVENGMMPEATIDYLVQNTPALKSVLSKDEGVTWKAYFSANHEKRDFFVMWYINENFGISYNPEKEKEEIKFKTVLEDCSYKIAPTYAKYKIDGDGNVVALSGDEYKNLINTGDESKDVLQIKISGVVRLKKGLSSGCLSGGLVYQNGLTEWLMSKTNNSDVVRLLNEISANPNEEERKNELKTKFAVFADKDGNVSESAVKGALGVADAANPQTISIYASNFENKDYVTDFIDEYNEKNPNNAIEYSDIMGTLFTSVSKIVNAITYVLVAFISISLVVSSIMIGIITYISVLERTKEIGVLRSIGASKGNVATVFNAEALIIGFASGLLGVLIAVLINIPISAILLKLTGVAIAVQLPVSSGIALLLISMLLTTIAGFIPSRIASKKDPVVALRTES